MTVYTIIRIKQTTPRPKRKKNTKKRNKNTIRKARKPQHELIKPRLKSSASERLSLLAQIKWYSWFNSVIFQSEFVYKKWNLSVIDIL